MGHCGVTLEERRQPQPLMVDLELECNPDEAIAKDDISKTVDYANITARIVQLGSSHHCALLETLADHLSRALLAEFAISTLHIWVRKTTPPTARGHWFGRGPADSEPLPNVHS